jgi:hypothetical protein
MKIQLKAISHKTMIDRQVAQIAEAEWVAREILVGMDSSRCQYKKVKKSQN